MHGGHGHGHAHVTVSADTNRRRLTIALTLILVFLAGEVTVGILVHSLALLSDAAHMLTDAAAIALSLVALRLAARPAAGSMTFGLKRAEILSAQVNGATLLILGVLVVYEAIRRLVDPPDVEGLPVLVVALVGVAVNVAATWQLAKANRENMAIEGSFQHLVNDLYAFIGTVVAAVVILATGFTRADPIASLVVAGLMFYAAYGLLRDSGRVLLEAAPAGMSPAAIGAALAAHPSVVEVHDLHVWQISSDFPALSAHVLVRPGDDCHEARRSLEELLDREFGIDHTTLQVDHSGDGRLLEIGRHGSERP